MIHDLKKNEYPAIHGGQGGWCNCYYSYDVPYDKGYYLLGCADLPENCANAAINYKNCPTCLTICNGTCPSLSSTALAPALGSFFGFVGLIAIGLTASIIYRKCNAPGEQ